MVVMPGDEGVKIMTARDSVWVEVEGEGEGGETKTVLKPSVPFGWDAIELGLFDDKGKA